MPARWLPWMLPGVLMVLSVALGAGDILTTLRVLALAGSGLHEGNPALTALYRQWGVVGLIVPKLALYLGALVFGMAWAYTRHATLRSAIARLSLLRGLGFALVFVNLVTAVVVANNLVLLPR